LSASCSAARRGLRQSRRETAAASQERDDLISERDTARAYTASNLGNGTAAQDQQVSAAGNHWSRLGDFRRRFGPVRDSKPPASQAALGAPASSSSPDVAAASPAADVPADVPAAVPAAAE
jgi:hypothetical protein